MLCQHCQQREANVHFHKKINGQATDVYLCQPCAAKYQQESMSLHPGMIIPEFLQALFGLIPAAGHSAAQAKVWEEKQACPNCGLSFDEISHSGKLGCSMCHETFNSQIEPLLRRIHGGGQHVGKIPLRRGVELREKLELKRLKEELQNYISREEFEQAALVRDKIKQMEQKSQMEQKTGG